MDDVVNGYLARYSEGESITIGKVSIGKDIVAVTGTGLSFSWAELAIREYNYYFSIYKIRQAEFHLWVRYDEWNSVILLSVLKSLKAEWEGRHQPE